MQGQLSEKPIAYIIRGLARKNASGLLRVSRGKSIKAIFFESGNPVFAISNAANEQLEHLLVEDGYASAAQIEEARTHFDKVNKLGATLIEMGIISEETLGKTVRQQVLNIIFSLFEWEQGEYIFDERMRTSHEITITEIVTDILLEGGRHASRVGKIAQQIAPPEAVIIRGDIDKEKLDSGKLVPIESYVLSRIESPTLVNEVGQISGLPDGEAHRAVCALVASGFLKLFGEDREDEPADTGASEAVEKAREDILRKLQYTDHADFYEILEISRQATTAEVKAAYYQLAKKYHPDRYRHVVDPDLRSHLETLFARITQAYETLSETGRRSAYNIRLRSGAATTPKTEIKTPITVKTNPLPPLKPMIPSGPLDDDKPRPSPSGALSNPVSHSVSQEAAPNAAAPQKSAEYYYQQGRARLERKEFHAAIHLLREAIRIDPVKAPYHFHLGNALIRNPKTRREADEHLSKAAELDPYNSQMRVKLGILYKEMGLKKRAEHFFKDALSMDPENKAARKGLGEVGNKKKAELASIWKSDMGSIAKRLFKR